MNMKCAFIFALVLGMILLSFPTFGQESREVKKTIPLESDGKVCIDTYKGSIQIDTWDKPEVSIVVRIEADGHGRKEQRKVQDTEIRIHSSDRNVDIKTDYSDIEERGFSFFGLFTGDNGSMPLVHYTITMPATARLKIKDYKSETTIKNLKASLRLETYKGSVEILRQDGPIDLETYKGDVRVEYARYTGASTYETYKGKIDLTIPRDGGFNLDADIGRRAEFDTDFDFNRRHKSHDDETYHATVNGGGSSLRVSTEKGEINIRTR